MQQQFNQLTMPDMEEDANLIDCYRIALDFGMPAALKAYEKLLKQHKLLPKQIMISIKLYHEATLNLAA